MITMSKLAELAGVSVSTVSKAFSKSPEISKEKREYIYKVAKANGCYDKFCKNIYEGTVIGVICPEFKSRLNAENLSLLDEQIKKNKGIMISCCTDFKEKREEEILKYFTEVVKVDGIISLTQLYSDKKFSVPIVMVGESKNNSSIILSEEKAVLEAISLLKENNHKDIAFVGDKYTSERLKLFRDAMKKNDMEIKEEYIIVGERRFEDMGFTAMKKLLEMNKKPTAVFAAYDNIAIGVIKCIKEHGLKVPDDISIIGSDNIKETPYLDVPLTSVTSYNEDLCQIMVKTLYERIKKPEETTKIRISKQLIKRKSVVKAPKK